jgi:hypothetical protein
MPFLWTLIIMIVGSGANGGAAINHVKFSTAAMCESARDAVLKEWASSSIQVHAICVKAAPGE